MVIDDRTVVIQLERIRTTSMEYEITKYLKQLIRKARY